MIDWMMLVRENERASGRTEEGSLREKLGGRYQLRKTGAIQGATLLLEVA